MIVFTSLPLQLAFAPPKFGSTDHGLSSCSECISTATLAPMPFSGAENEKTRSSPAYGSTFTPFTFLTSSVRVIDATSTPPNGRPQPP